MRLLNYKKNGQPFWNLFTLAPMADVDGNLRFIIGVQACTGPASHRQPPQSCCWSALGFGLQHLWCSCGAGHYAARM